MRLLTRNALALLAVLVLLPSTALAQATLGGVVRDTSGAVLYDGFELVVGRVLDVAERRARTYLNFDVDWKTDFTVSIETRHRRLFEREGWDLAALKDRLVRVRGVGQALQRAAHRGHPPRADRGHRGIDSCVTLLCGHLR